MARGGVVLKALAANSLSSPRFRAMESCWSAQGLHWASRPKARDELKLKLGRKQIRLVCRQRRKRRRLKRYRSSSPLKRFQFAGPGNQGTDMFQAWYLFVAVSRMGIPQSGFVPGFDHRLLQLWYWRCSRASDALARAQRRNAAERSRSQARDSRTAKPAVEAGKPRSEDLKRKKRSSWLRAIRKLKAPRSARFGPCRYGLEACA